MSETFNIPLAVDGDESIPLAVDGGDALPMEVETAIRSSGGGGGAVNSVNGQTGDVVLDAADVGALPDDTTAADLGAYVKPSGGIPKTDLASAVQTSLGKADTALQTAPVSSVNGQTGAVTVTEGLAPLIGTTATVTPAQVAAALSEGRDICISGTFTGFVVPLELKFASWNRATDTVYSGTAVDVVVSQTIIENNSAFILFELWGGVFNGQSQAWEINYAQLAQYDDISAAAPVSSVNGQTGTVELNIPSTAADVGAIAAPSSPAAGAFLVYNGSAWVAQTLATWSGGSY